MENRALKEYRDNFRYFRADRLSFRSLEFVPFPSSIECVESTDDFAFRFPFELVLDLCLRRVVALRLDFDAFNLGNFLRDGPRLDLRSGLESVILEVVVVVVVLRRK